mgnify:CR=1 FL=1
MAIDFSSQAAVSLGGSTKLTVDTNGSFLVPAQYTFNVMSGAATAAGADVIAAGTQLFNIGSCYNSTNGRFTAPIAGIYFVRFHQLAQNATTGEFRTAIYLNGAGYGGLRFITYKAAAAWWTLIAEGYVKLAVNDYITVRYESGGAALYTDSNYASFSGHYVG